MHNSLGASGEGVVTALPNSDKRVIFVFYPCKFLGKLTTMFPITKLSPHIHEYTLFTANNYCTGQSLAAPSLEHVTNIDLLTVITIKIT